MNDLILWVTKKSTTFEDSLPQSHSKVAEHLNFGAKEKRKKKKKNKTPRRSLSCPTPILPILGIQQQERFQHAKTRLCSRITTTLHHAGSKDATPHDTAATLAHPRPLPRSAVAREAATTTQPPASRPSIPRKREDRPVRRPGPRELFPPCIDTHGYPDRHHARPCRSVESFDLTSRLPLTNACVAR
jgi:hypothetical protein